MNVIRNCKANNLWNYFLKKIKSSKKRGGMKGDEVCKGRKCYDSNIMNNAIVFMLMKYFSTTIG